MEVAKDHDKEQVEAEVGWAQTWFLPVSPSLSTIGFLCRTQKLQLICVRLCKTYPLSFWPGLLILSLYFLGSQWRCMTLNRNCSFLGPSKKLLPTRCLKSNIYSLIVEQARSLKSNCQQCCFFSGGSEGKTVPCLSQLPVAAGNLELSLACRLIIPVCPHLHIIFSYKDTSHWI